MRMLLRRFVPVSDRKPRIGRAGRREGPVIFLSGGPASPVESIRLRPCIISGESIPVHCIDICAGETPLDKPVEISPAEFLLIRRAGGSPIVISPGADRRAAEFIADAHLSQG